MKAVLATLDATQKLHLALTDYPSIKEKNVKLILSTATIGTLSTST